MVQAFCVEHRVKPMPRPRLNGHRIYVPDVTSELANNFAQQMHGGTLACPLIVDCHFHFRAPEKGGLWPVSQTIGDEDNLRKTVNDALVQAGVLEDDRFVVGGETSKIYGDNDYVWVFIYAVSSNIERAKYTSGTAV